jgi:hypothetical protein
MSKFTPQVLALGILCAGTAFGQLTGSFGQIAFGGSWQTTLKLINTSPSDTSNVVLSFFGDNGSPLIVPIADVGNRSDYEFQIPANGTTDVVLTSSDPNTTQGWARLSMTGSAVRGQGIFSFLVPKGNGTISEAVVPFILHDDPTCVVPIPNADPVILVPFDNTVTSFRTSMAFVNTDPTTTSRTFVLEFKDQFSQMLVATTLTLPSLAHTAFVTPERFPVLLGKKGILRVHASKSDLTVLGLLSNLTGSIATIIPLTD